jgi:hypothetical protein
MRRLRLLFRRRSRIVRRSERIVEPPAPCFVSSGARLRSMGCTIPFSRPPSHTMAQTKPAAFVNTAVGTSRKLRREAAAPLILDPVRFEACHDELASGGLIGASWSHPLCG